MFPFLHPGFLSHDEDTLRTCSLSKLYAGRETYIGCKRWCVLGAAECGTMAIAGYSLWATTLEPCACPGGYLHGDYSHSFLFSAEYTKLPSSMNTGDWL